MEVGAAMTLEHTAHCVSKNNNMSNAAIHSTLKMFSTQPLLKYAEVYPPKMNEFLAEAICAYVSTRNLPNVDLVLYGFCITVDSRKTMALP